MEIQESLSPEKKLEEGTNGQLPPSSVVKPGNQQVDLQLINKNKLGKLKDSLGVHYITSSKRWGYRELILDPHKPFLRKWTGIFVSSCIIGLLFDPLFFYIPIIDGGKPCVKWDKRLEITAVVLRCLTDAIYIINIIFQFITGYIIARPAIDDLVKDARAITKQYLISYFVIDILAVLPLPQVIILVIIPRVKDPKFFDAKNLLKFAILLQYVPRVLRIYPLYRKATWTSVSLSKTAWTEAVFNLFLFILASHVLGAFWYFFSIERATACWQQACENHVECVNESFYCSDGLLGKPFLLDYCPIMTPNSTQFDFGIFTGALQSGIVGSMNFPQKLVRCFWWGLQSLSSLGQNLDTSNYIWENCFAIIVTFIGLFLLLCVLGNMQLYLQFTTLKSEEMRLEGRDLEMWMDSHSIHEDVRGEIRQYRRYKRKESRTIDVEKLFRSIPQRLADQVKEQVCLGLLMKVPELAKLDYPVLHELIKRLKPAFYEEDSYIIHEAHPMEEMLFIVRGKLLTVSYMGKNGFLKDGDIFGEEIIKWTLSFPNTSHSSWSSHLPVSKKTVQAVTKVEAFKLAANDFKTVASENWLEFSKKLQSQIIDTLGKPAGKKRRTMLWEAMAASKIQLIWRRYIKEKKGMPPRLTIVRRRLKSF